MTDASPCATVAAWHSAIDAKDPRAIADVTAADVVVVGPRGTATGLPIVQEWATHAGIRLQPVRAFARAEEVVVEQLASWRDPDSEVWTDPTTIATAFTVASGKITRIVRFPDLTSALAATTVTFADHVAGFDEHPRHPTGDRATPGSSA